MKKFLPDLIAILAFIVISFIYFFLLSPKTGFSSSTTPWPEPEPDKKPKNIMREQVNVPAGPMHSSEYAYLPDVPELRLYRAADICTESISPFSSELRMAHIYHDARVLYPAKGIRYTGMARRVRRNHLGIFVLFLHSDSCRTYLEIYYFGLYSTYDSRYSTCLPKEISVRRYYHRFIHGYADIVQPCADDLLFLVCYSFHGRRILRRRLAKKRTPQFFKATGVLIVAGLIGVSINLSNLYHTYEYSKETMRGKSELKYEGACCQTD